LHTEFLPKVFGFQIRNHRPEHQSEASDSFTRSRWLWLVAAKGRRRLARKYK